MPNYPGPIVGQQAVTTVATALPSVIPGNPMGSGGGAPLGAAAAVRGEGWRVILENRSGAAGNQAIFYGSSNAVTTANGKEIPQGSQDSFKVNDLAQIFVIAASNNAIVSWSVTVDP